MYSYYPNAISGEDAAAIMARLGRYVFRHSLADCEFPLSDDGRQEAVSQIAIDWQGADWLDMEWKHIMRTGRTLFDPDAPAIANHLRAALYCAGRCRKRGWRDASPEARRVARGERRREPGDFSGAGMASRAPSPERVAMAIETAQKGGLSSIPRREAAKRLRWAKTRNSGTKPVPVAFFADVTYIRWERGRRNFERVGSVPARQLGRTRRPVKGFSPAQLREAITG